MLTAEEKKEIANGIIEAINNDNQKSIKNESIIAVLGDYYEVARISDSKQGSKVPDGFKQLFEERNIAQKYPEVIDKMELGSLKLISNKFDSDISKKFLGEENDITEIQYLKNASKIYDKVNSSTNKASTIEDLDLIIAASSELVMNALKQDVAEFDSFKKTYLEKKIHEKYPDTTNLMYYEAFKEIYNDNPELKKDILEGKYSKEDISKRDLIICNIDFKEDVARHDTTLDMFRVGQLKASTFIEAKLLIGQGDEYVMEKGFEEQIRAASKKSDPNKPVSIFISSHGGEDETRKETFETINRAVNYSEKGEKISNRPVRIIMGRCYGELSSEVANELPKGSVLLTYSSKIEPTISRKSQATQSFPNTRSSEIGNFAQFSFANTRGDKPMITYVPYEDGVKPVQIELNSYNPKEQNIPKEIVSFIEENKNYLNQFVQNAKILKKFGGVNDEISQKLEESKVNNLSQNYEKFKKVADKNLLNGKEYSKDARSTADKYGIDLPINSPDKSKDKKNEIKNILDRNAVDPANVDFKPKEKVSPIVKWLKEKWNAVVKALDAIVEAFGALVELCSKAFKKSPSADEKTTDIRIEMQNYQKDSIQNENTNTKEREEFRKNEIEKIKNMPEIKEMKKDNAFLKISPEKDNYKNLNVAVSKKTNKEKSESKSNAF